MAEDLYPFDGGSLNLFGVGAISAVYVSADSTTITATGRVYCSVTTDGTGDYDPSVTWSVESGEGTINSDGIYTASALPTSAVIRATSVEDPLLFDEVTITVLEAPAAGTGAQRKLALSMALGF